MNKAKRFVFSLSTLILFSGVALATAPAYAENGSSGGSSDTNTSTTDNTSTTGDQNETEVETHGHDLADQFRLEAKDKIAEKKTQVKEHSQEERQKSCEARKAELSKRMSRAVAQAQKHKEVFDKIYTKVQNFYTEKKLSVADYDSLKAKVDSAQADAAASIQALKDTDVSLDCTSSTVADSISAFQTAVGNSRDSLKAYRAALVDLINSLKGASTSQDHTQSQDNTNNTNQ